MTPSNKDTIATIIILLVAFGILIAAILSPGCVASNARVRKPVDRALESGGMTDRDCVDLMERRDGASLAGKILAGVGGVSALGAAPKSFPDGARWGIAAGAATAAAVSVAVLWYGERKSDQFEAYCEEVPRMADGGVE